MTDTTIQGHRVRLLSTRQAPGVLLDTWEDLGQPVGSVSRVGIVATFQRGHDLADGDTGLLNPFVPDPVIAMGYVDQASADPVARFHEALGQERVRARERLSSPLSFTDD